MSVFEYISVAASIVLALGVGKLLSASGDIFDKDRRDALHIAWCVYALLAVLVQWRSIWDLSGNENWNLAQFFAVMASPMTFYVLAHLLVSNSPEKVEDWRVHLSRVRPALCATLAIAMLVFWLRHYLVLDAVLILPFSATLLTVSIVGIFVDRRWLLVLLCAAWFWALIASSFASFQFDVPSALLAEDAQ